MFFTLQSFLLLLFAVAVFLSTYYLTKFVANRFSILNHLFHHSSVVSSFRMTKIVVTILQYMTAWLIFVFTNVAQSFYTFSENFLLTQFASLALILLISNILSYLFYSKKIRILGVMAVFNIIVQIIDQEGLINTTLSSLILDVFMFKFSAKQVILIIFYGYAVITFAEIWKNSSKMVINATKMSDDDKMIFTKVLRYIGYFVLILFFLKIAAIDTKQIAFITGALSFGVGFGLQKIFANFISGIFVLFEKKIKLDDLVELSNGKIGYVKKIDIRSTVLQDFSGQSIVVPNEEFLIQIITNMTLFSRRHGVVALFCVNHDADLNFVLELCKKVGTSICGEGNFSCRINEVRDYGVEIYNRIWINKIDDEIMDVWKLKSEVIKNIQAELYKHNIHFAKRISFTNQNV